MTAKARTVGPSHWGALVLTVLAAIKLLAVAMLLASTSF